MPSRQAPRFRASVAASLVLRRRFREMKRHLLGQLALTRLTRTSPVTRRSQDSGSQSIRLP